MCLKKSLQVCFAFIGIFIFSFSISVQSQNTWIWYIGKINDINSTTPKKVIDFLVPENWSEVLDQEDPNWGEFPSQLYSGFDRDKKPQEIRINFDYPEDYINPKLSIVATIDSHGDKDVYHYLVIYKGEKESIAELRMKDFVFYYDDISVGYLKKGLHNENRIIIKVESPSDIPIVFDSLGMYINENDTDEDGVSDDDEGDLNISNDKATVSIPIKSYNPKDIERITLHIEEAEGSSLCFRDVKFLDANSLNLPLQLLLNHYFPYGFLGFRIEDIKLLKEVTIQIDFKDIDYPEREVLYPSGRFYTYQDTNQWQEGIFEILDEDTAKITLLDGGTGDFDGQQNGSIHTKLFLAYPRSLGIHIEKKGCFIEGIFSR